MKLNFELPEKVKLKVLQSLMTDILYAVPLGMDVTGQKRKESWFVIGTDKWLTVQDGEIEKVELLGGGKAKFRRTSKGLLIDLPKDKTPNPISLVLKITNR